MKAGVLKSTPRFVFFGGVSKNQYNLEKVISFFFPEVPAS